MLLLLPAATALEHFEPSRILGSTLVQLEGLLKRRRVNSNSRMETFLEASSRATDKGCYRALRGGNDSFCPSPRMTVGHAWAAWVSTLILCCNISELLPLATPRLAAHT